MKLDELFAMTAREYLEAEDEEDYYYKQYLAGLDHNELNEDLSDMARYFFRKGFEAGAKNAKD